MKIGWISLLLLPLMIVAQPPDSRYQEELFSTWTETSEVLFSTGVPQPEPGGGFYEFITGYPLNVDEFDTNPVNLYMDIFEPAGDTLSARPLVIICFGGGFLSGSKDHWSIRLLCQDLAKRGYVTAAIDYRLGMNVFDADLAMRAVYRGLQDASSAVRFFRADAAGSNTYRIDPNQIYLGGHSSGAFMALHNAYLDKETERPISTYNWIQDGQPVADQLCINCVGDNLAYDGRANSIFSLAGALGFTSFIETAEDPKVNMFHSTDDDTVPYDSGGPFSSIIWLVIGSDLPTVYGSLPISIQASSVELPYEFFSYTDRGHGVHEDGGSSLYSDIVPGISDWFYVEELKPLYSELKGPPIVCNTELQQTYYLNAGQGAYFDWKIIGGAFIQINNNSNEATVLWDNNAPVKSISVIPYSELDARGDSLYQNINILPSGINQFLYTDGDWNNPANWSLGMLPEACQDIVLGDLNNVPVIFEGVANINSLQIDENVSFETMVNSTLSINQKSLIPGKYSLIIDGSIMNQGSLELFNIQKENILDINNSGILTNQNTGIIVIQD